MFEPLDIQRTDSEILAELTRVQRIGLKEYFFGYHLRVDARAGAKNPAVEEGAYLGIAWPSFRALVSSSTATPIPVRMLSFSEIRSYPDGNIIRCSISILREGCNLNTKSDLDMLPALSRRLLARFRAFGEQQDLFEAISCYNFLESTLRDSSDRMAYLEAALGLIDSMLCRYVYLRWGSDAQRISELVFYCTTIIPDDAFHSDLTVWNYINAHWMSKDRAKPEGKLK